MNSTLNKVYVIAEIGVNHNGDLELAKKMIEAAKQNGADAVKFQTFTAERLVGNDVPKVAYQRERTDATESHYEMIKKLELSEDGHRVLLNYCKALQIDFLSTPYSIEDAQFLSTLDVSAFKVASADIVDLPLLRFLASQNKPSIVSTGMATLDEVQEAYEIFRAAGKTHLLTLLHCVSNYPCKLSSLNMRVLQTLSTEFKVKVGYSDHAVGNEASIAAVALGAEVIEKHFTLDHSLPGPDHAASCSPEQFKSLVDSIRATETLLGTKEKRVQTEELEMRKVSRKSITFKMDLKAGHVITAEDVCLKRPGTGFMARDMGQFLGKKLRQDVSKNTLALLDHLKN